MDEGMKKLSIYMEIAGAARDEYGNPQPAGVSLTIGDPNGDEVVGSQYRAILERITVEAVLEVTFLTDVYPASACRIIMPQEYQEKYGDTA